MGIADEIREMLHKQQKKTIQCSDPDDQIQRYEVKSSWIMHGAIGWLISILTLLLFQQALTHWFVIIQTKKGKYYTLQYTGETSELTQHKNYQAAEYRAKCYSCALNNWPEKIYLKYTKHSCARMSDVIDFVNRDDAVFRVLNKSCQHFAAKFYKEI